MDGGRDDPRLEKPAAAAPEDRPGKHRRQKLHAKSNIAATAGARVFNIVLLHYAY